MVMTDYEQTLALSWCKDYHDQLMELVIDRLGDAKKACEYVPELDALVDDIFSDTYLFDFSGEFLSKVGYCGPSEEYEMKMFAAEYLVDFIQRKF